MMFGRGARALGAGLRSSDNFDIVAGRFPFGLRDAGSQKVHGGRASLCDKGGPVCMVSCDCNGECMWCVNMSRSRSSRGGELDDATRQEGPHIGVIAANPNAATTPKFYVVPVWFHNM